VQYGPSGEVLVFDVSFEQHANGAAAALTGRIRYHASNPAIVGVLDNDSTSAGNPLTGTVVAWPQHGNLSPDADGGFRYTPDPGFTGSDTFQYQANDGVADSNVATVSITVLPFSHAPQGAANTISVSAGTPYALQMADFGFSDPHDTPADSFTGVIISTLPSSGNLTLAGTPVAAGQFVSVNDIAAGNLVLTLPTGAARTSRVSFTFQVEDSGSTNLGGAILDPSPKTLTFDLPPVAVDDAYTVNENGQLDESLTSTWLQMISQPGDTVGGGQTYSYDSTYTYSVSRNSHNGISVLLSRVTYGWFDWVRVPIAYEFGPTLDFAAPGDAPLALGTYSNAQRYPSQDANAPGMAVSGRMPIVGPLSGLIGGTVPSLTGQFTVNEIQYGPSGEILSFDVSFEQHANGAAAALTGRIRYHLPNSGSISVLQNDSDADGDPLTAVLVTWPQHGAVTLDSQGGFVYTPFHDYHGPDSFQYRANDGAADSNVATVTINVTSVSQAPAGTSTTLTPAAGTPYVLHAADFGFSDPDDSPADTFTRVEITTLPSAGSLTLAGATVVAGQFVTVADLAAGSLVFTPLDAARTSRASFTFQVEDSGSTGNGGVKLDPTPKTLAFNVAPIAQDDAYSVSENQALVLSQLSAPGATSVLQNDTDADGDPLTAVVVAWPQHGTLTSNGNGGWVYAPDHNYHGPDSFQYRANDGAADSNTATVTIGVVQCSQAPAGTSTTRTLPPGAPYVLHAADFGFSDPDDLPVNLFTRVEITTLPSGGSLTLAGTPVVAGQFVTVADLTAGSLVFTTVDAARTSRASFTFQVEDSGSTANGGVNLDPMPKTLAFNAAPIAQDDVYSVRENQVLDLSQLPAPGATSVFQNDTDADGDALSATLVTGPLHGTLSLDAAGGFVYTPNPYFSGVDTFQYQANDGAAQSNVATVTINVTHVSQPPAGTSGVLSIPAGAPYALQAGDFGFADLHDSPTDDFAQVAITTLPTSGTLTLAGTPVVAGQLITVADLAAGKLLFTPANRADGSPHASFTFQVEDSGSPSADGVAATPTRVEFSDGSFEQHRVGTGYAAYEFAPDGTGWTFGTQIGHVANSGIAGDGSAYDAPTAPDGTQAAFVQNQGSFWQDINFPQAGKYTLRFKSAYRNDYGGANKFEVWVDDTLVGTFLPTSSSTFENYSATFSVDAGTHRIKFAGKNQQNQQGDQVSFIDAISIGGSRDNLDPSPKTLTINMTPSASDNSYTVHENGVLDQSRLATRMAIGSWEVNGPGTFAVYSTGNELDFCYPADSSWTDNGVAICFIAPGNSRLEPGVYQADPAYWNDSSLAGLEYFINGSWSFPSEQFTVNQAVYDSSGELVQFDATFSEGHLSWNAWLPGDVRLLQNDTDADGDPLSAVLVAAPQHGTLSLDADGGFIYTPNPNFFGTDSFQYKANDGMADSNVATVTIDVTHVSQAPSGTDGTANVMGGAAYTLTGADFGFADLNDTPADSFTRVEITTLPSSGTLTLAGLPVVAGQFVTVADLAAGNLVFTPPADAARTSRTSFTFQVEDSGSTDNGGVTLDPLPNTLSFDLIPVANNDTYTVDENATLDESLFAGHLTLSVYDPNTTGNAVPHHFDQGEANFQITQDTYGVTLSCSDGAEQWNLYFAPAAGGRLYPNAFSGAGSSPSDACPSMLISESGHPNAGTVAGQFTVNSVLYGPTGEIQELDITFQQSTDASGWTCGRLQYRMPATSTAVGVLQNDTDADGDRLTAVLVAGPQHGTLSMTSDGGFIYTPAANFFGTDSFQYRASDGAGQSNVATVTINVPFVSQMPLGTSNVAPLPTKETSTSFLVTWSGSDNAGGAHLASYDVYVSDNGGDFHPWLTGTTETSATFAGHNGHCYAFYSLATDDLGHCEAAPAVADTTTTVDAQSPTTIALSTDHLSGSKYGEAVTFTVTVSATDTGVGEPTGSVWLVVDGNAFGAATALNHGTASIIVSSLHAGNHNIDVVYTSDDPATFEDGHTASPLSSHIDPVALTITANNQTKVYGAALPTLTATYAGFVNGDKASSLTTAVSLSTTATAGSHVSGSPYAIHASGAADADYTIAYVDGTLAVTPAPLTVTAENKTKVYGAALPGLTASYAGFVNGDTAARLTTAVSLSTTATAGSHVSGSP
jgi:hypothetical protein